MNGAAAVLASTPDLPTSGPHPSGDAVQPIAFGAMLGWLHRPATVASDVGVVVCAPAGRDARCAHLLLRWTAEALAEAGYPVLRFDYRGCGDALDLEPGADAVAAWTDDVQGAAEALRAATGVQRLVFHGLRLGASLAALAAERRDDVAGLMLLAPVMRGRAWVRELRLAAELSTPAHRPGPALGPSPPDEAAPSTVALESDGLQLSAATLESLGRLDLEALASAPRDILLASRSAPPAPWLSHLAGLGAEVETADFPGYDLLFDESHSNVAPQALIEAALAWMRARFPVDAVAEAAPASPPATAELRPPGAVERPVAFGAGLKGVLCLPADGSRDGRAAVFCNTGGDPRVGAGRFSAQAARRLAKDGVASLRFDFAGLGDSATAEGRVRSHVYEASRRADLDAALDLLAREGLDRPVLVGLCAGAYHSFWGGEADPRVKGLLLVSLVKLVWRRGDSVSIGQRDQAGSARSYVQGLGDPAIWRRLFKGEVRVGAIAASLLRRFGSRLQAYARRRERSRVRRAAQALSARGVKAHLMLGLDDGSLDELETYFGRDGRDWAALPGLTVDIVEGLDHGLLRAASRTVVIERLRRLMGDLAAA